MDYLFGLFVGIGLSAACGFRVFVPMLGMSIAARSGQVVLSPGFEWIGGYPALVALSIATLVEIGGYFVPWLDNLLDTLAAPAAIVAASILTASQLGEATPFLRWSLALIAGGGVCGVIQGATSLTRAMSTVTTGGLANSVVSIAELAMSILMTFLAIALPIVALLIVVLLLYVSIIKLALFLARRRNSVQQV